MSTSTHPNVTGAPNSAGTTAPASTALTTKRKPVDVAAARRILDAATAQHTDLKCLAGLSPSVGIWMKDLTGRIGRCRKTLDLIAGMPAEPEPAPSTPATGADAGTGTGTTEAAAANAAAPATAAKKSRASKKENAAKKPTRAQIRELIFTLRDIGLLVSLKRTMVNLLGQTMVTNGEFSDRNEQISAGRRIEADAGDIADGDESVLRDVYTCTGPLEELFAALPDDLTKAVARPKATMSMSIMMFSRGGRGGHPGGRGGASGDLISELLEHSDLEGLLGAGGLRMVMTHGGGFPGGFPMGRPRGT